MELGETATLGQLAKLVEGRLIGDPEIHCFGAGVPEEVTGGEITMIDDPKRAESMGACPAVAIVTPQPINVARPHIVVKDSHEAFAKIVSHFRPRVEVTVPGEGIAKGASIDETAVIHPSAVISDGVIIGQRTRIMPGVVVMPFCRIGDDCVIHSSVTLYEYTEVADRVTIHAGSVLGAHGFGYRQQAGRHIPTAQLGYVVVESDVEIGASATIDRGTYGSTRIGEGTKIDNQVMIAHNCQIGKHNLICSQVGIAGSSQTGDHVILAGQVGLKDHISLGDRVIVGAQAGVMEDLESDNVYLGSPATSQREQMQIMAVERRLPEMRRELKRLTRDVSSLQRRISLAEASSSEPGESSDQRAA